VWLLDFFFSSLELYTQKLMPRICQEAISPK